MTMVGGKHDGKYGELREKSRTEYLKKESIDDRETRIRNEERVNKFWIKTQEKNCRRTVNLFACEQSHKRMQTS